MGPVFKHTQLTMKAFICSALLAVASAAPQLLTRGLAGHGLVGGGLVGHGLVGGGLGHGLVGRGIVGHGVVAHPVAHAVGGYVNDLAEPSPYTYQYAVSDDYSGSNFAQTESNDGTGAVSGSYSVNLPDGRIQHVNYNANDLTGNIAEVTYEGAASYPDVVGAGHGLVGRGVVGHGLVGHGLVGQGLVGHGIAGHGLVGGGVVGHGLVGHGIAGHGLVGRGVVGHGLVGRVAPVVGAPVSPLSNGVRTAVIG